MIKTLAVVGVLTDASGDFSALLNATPAVGHGADVGVETQDRVLGADQKNRRLEHGRSHRNFREIMTRLRIEERRGSNAESGIFENSATNRDIGLSFGQITRLHVNAGFEPQSRDRHCKTPAGGLIGHLSGQNYHCGEHGAIVKGDLCDEWRAGSEGNSAN